MSFSNEKPSLLKQLEIIAWLEGTWRCERAHGFYPTIRDFWYGEEIQFKCMGQPLLNYSAKSWNIEKRTPMHLESGFLRLRPQSNKVALFVAHNFGVNTVEEGEIHGTELRLVSTSVVRMSFAKQPPVKKIIRIFRLEGETLVHELYMETPKTKMCQHLAARYEKVNEIAPVSEKDG